MPAKPTDGSGEGGATVPSASAKCPLISNDEMLRLAREEADAAQKEMMEKVNKGEITKDKVVGMATVFASDDGKVFVGRSGGAGGTGIASPQTQKDYDAVPESDRAKPYQHGWCGECDVLSQAENASASTNGGRIISVGIGTPGQKRHGETRACCPSCSVVAKNKGITDISGK